MAPSLHPMRAKPHLIFIALAVLIALLLLVLFHYFTRVLSFEQAYVFLQAIGIVATISLLYFAYVNVLSSRTKDIAAAELAVRPILVWKIEEGKRTLLTYRAIKHPIYDLEFSIELCAKKRGIFERHLDVSEQNAKNERAKGEKSEDISSFLKSALGNRSSGKLFILITYHSEVGGRYEALFSKEIKAGTNGVQLLDRKIIWAKYPWHEEKVYFD